MDPPLMPLFPPLQQREDRALTMSLRSGPLQALDRRWPGLPLLILV